MSGLQERASGTVQPASHDHMPVGATAVAGAQQGAPGIPSESPYQSHPGPSSEGTSDVTTGHAPEAAREPAGAEGQPAGQLGDLPDKPGHLATAEQCRLANGGVCWHLLQMAVRARQIAQKSDDDSVSLPCKCLACMPYVACVVCMVCMACMSCKCDLFGVRALTLCCLQAKPFIAVQQVLWSSVGQSSPGGYKGLPLG